VQKCSSYIYGGTFYDQLTANLLLSVEMRTNIAIENWSIFDGKSSQKKLGGLLF